MKSEGGALVSDSDPPKGDNVSLGHMAGTVQASQKLFDRWFVEHRRRKFSIPFGSEKMHIFQVRVKRVGRRRQPLAL